jgi:ABC-type transport system involved in multi-copper enzyme maturation permease subunit
VLGTITYGFIDRVVRSIGLGGIAIALDLIALLVGTTLIHQEIDKKTLFVVLVRPVRRFEYLVGRYLGLVATLALTLIGLSAVFFFALSLSNGNPQQGDFVALAAALPESAILAGVGIVLSTFSTPTIASGIGIGIWIVGETTDDFVQLTLKAEPSVHAIAQIAYYVFPGLSRFNFRELAIYNMSATFAEYGGAFIYGVAYCVFLGALGSIILSRREMV